MTDILGEIFRKKTANPAVRYGQRFATFMFCPEMAPVPISLAIPCIPRHESAAIV